MKNIEKYGVEELNTIEIQKINGGILDKVLKGIAALVFWHWDNWDDIKAGFESAQQ